MADLLRRLMDWATPHHPACASCPNPYPHRLNGGRCQHCPVGVVRRNGWASLDAVREAEARRANHAATDQLLAEAEKTHAVLREVLKGDTGPE